MKPLVVDIETTIRSNISNKGSAFEANNYIVKLGYCTNPFSISPKVTIVDGLDKIKIKDFIFGPLLNADIIIGHNIGGFDLHWLRRLLVEHNLSAYNLFIVKGIKIWDTQIADYVLSGQFCRMQSLDQSAKRWGGTQKDEKIKEYWKNDIDTNQIPSLELEEYLKNDVLNTALIFKKQLEFIHKKSSENPNLFTLLEINMQARLATSEMEWNGLTLNTTLANVIRQQLDIRRIDLEEKLKLTMDEFFKVYIFSELNKITNNDLSLISSINTGTISDFTSNPSSNLQLKTMIFGGTIKVKIDFYQKDENDVFIVYKTGAKRGNKKSIKKEIYIPIPTFLDVSTKHYESINDSVDDENLNKIIKLLKNKGYILSVSSEFLERILEYRKLNKEYSTYFVGYLAEVASDNRIHTSFNHTVTRTGRLSSSKPNLQNISNKNTEDLLSE